MKDLPREKLRELVATYGQSLCDDPRRCEALLRDYCAGHRREIHILVSALKERVAADLLGSQHGAPYEVQFARLTKRLRDNLGLADDAARWAVESWALALGVTANARQGSSAIEHKSSRVRTRARNKKRKTTATSEQPSSDTHKSTINSEKTSEFSGIRVTDRRRFVGLTAVGQPASGGLSEESNIESRPSLPIPAVSPLSRATRLSPTGIARLVFVGCLLLAGILIITGMIVAVPEVLEGDDPSEMAVYISIPAMLLLSISLVVLLPNLQFRIFLFSSIALFLAGALVVWRSEYFSTQSGPYWAYLTTATGPFSILGVLVGFAISKFITRKRERGADAQ